MASSNFIARLQCKYRRCLTNWFFRRIVTVKPSQAIVSFTFDDFPASAFKTGAPILEQYGLTATYYVSLGLAGRDGPVGRYFSESDLPQLVARGHELACHTFDHCHAWQTTPAAYEKSVIRNQERLHCLIPGSIFTAHSYPISNPRPATKANCAKHFSCARGGGQRANEQLADANHLAAFFIEKSRDNLPAITSMIKQAKTHSSWLILATHDISESPSRFGCTPELFNAIVRHTVESGVRVLPVSQAFRELHR